MTDFNSLITIRLAEPTDTNFIHATFLRGLYYGNSWFNLIPRDIFFPTYQKVVTALLASPNTLVTVACLKEDQDIIVGFSIISIDGEILHWVSVKKDWRRNGIAKALVPKNTKSVSHITKLGLELLPKLENVIFNPFI